MKLLRPLVAALLLAICLSAQAGTPAYREKGFKGSVGLLTGYDMFSSGYNIQLSNGYMFNAHHYLGAGLGGLSLDWNHPFSFDLLELFLEYDCYFLKSSVTPTAGINVSTFFDGQGGLIPYLQPMAGVSWGFGKYGLTLKAGALMLFESSEPDPAVYPHEYRVVWHDVINIRYDKNPKIKVTATPIIKLMFEF